MNQHKNICKHLVNFKMVLCKALLLNPNIGDENIKHSNQTASYYSLKISKILFLSFALPYHLCLGCSLTRLSVGLIFLLTLNLYWNVTLSERHPSPAIRYQLATLIQVSLFHLPYLILYQQYKHYQVIQISNFCNTPFPQHTRV